MRRAKKGVAQGCLEAEFQTTGRGSRGPTKIVRPPHGRTQGEAATTRGKGPSIERRKEGGSGGCGSPDSHRKAGGQNTQISSLFVRTPSLAGLSYQSSTDVTEGTGSFQRPRGTARGGEQSRRRK